MIIIIDNENRKLCQDNRWRGFADFGTYKSCVKIYKSLSAAKRKSEVIKGHVVKLPEDVTIEASGRVYRQIPTSPGYHRIENVDIRSLKLQFHPL